MADRRTGFSDDLRAIQGEVEADVGTILKIAKQARGVEASNPQPPADTKIASPQGQRTRPVDKRPKPQTLETVASPFVQNVTTRLTHRTNELLTEAALRQRLSKSTPATRQDIIEVAVCQWLAEHGYDRSTD